MALEGAGTIFNQSLGGLDISVIAAVQQPNNCDESIALLFGQPQPHQEEHKEIENELDRFLN